MGEFVDLSLPPDSLVSLLGNARIWGLGQVLCVARNMEHMLDVTCSINNNINLVGPGNSLGVSVALPSFTFPLRFRCVSVTFPSTFPLRFHWAGVSPMETIWKLSFASTFPLRFGCVTPPPLLLLTYLNCLLVCVCWYALVRVSMDF